MGSSIKAELDDDAKDVSGTVTVSYDGRYDGVAINAQVMGSNALVSFVSCNAKDVHDSKSRLFVPSADITDGGIEFAAKIVPPPKGRHEIRLRASIIEQHKEIESDLVFSTRD